MKMKNIGNEIYWKTFVKTSLVSKYGTEIYVNTGGPEINLIKFLISCATLKKLILNKRNKMKKELFFAVVLFSAVLFGYALGAGKIF